VSSDRIAVWRGGIKSCDHQLNLDGTRCFRCHAKPVAAAPPPEGQYRTIVADPPWKYEYSGGPGNAAPWRVGDAGHYPLMPTADICALGDEVSRLALPGAHLYLWATLPLMREALAVVDAWGFEYSTMLTWCKPGPGFGRGWRGNTEHLLVARDRRQKAVPFVELGAGTWYEAPRGEHSAKPELFLDLIERMSPGPFLEMFSRRARLGWSTWGNEALHGGAA
jgi:N6-adenosine-specific RNA methylase IME4